MKIPLVPITDWQECDTFVIQYNLGVVRFKKPDTREEMWQKGVHLTERDDALVFDHCTTLYNSHN